jgi:hypothetical protein
MKRWYCRKGEKKHGRTPSTTNLWQPRPYLSQVLFVSRTLASLLKIRWRSSQRPWLVEELTVASGAPVTASRLLRRLVGP